LSPDALPPSQLSQALAKTGALRQRRFAASSTGRASPPLPPFRQNEALNRALGPRGLAHSQRSISLYVSRPYAHVVRAGLFDRKAFNSVLFAQQAHGGQLGGGDGVPLHGVG